MHILSGCLPNHQFTRGCNQIFLCLMGLAQKHYLLLMALEETNCKHSWKTRRYFSKNAFFQLSWNYGKKAHCEFLFFFSIQQMTTKKPPSFSQIAEVISQLLNHRILHITPYIFQSEASKPIKSLHYLFKSLQ